MDSFWVAHQDAFVCQWSSFGEVPEGSTVSHWTYVVYLMVRKFFCREYRLNSKAATSFKTYKEEEI
jgi:hypothetical protein